MITEKATFSSFHSYDCKRNKFFHKNYATYQSKLSLKKWSQTEATQKKLLQRYIFYLTSKDPELNDGIKM